MGVSIAFYLSNKLLVVSFFKKISLSGMIFKLIAMIAISGFIIRFDFHVATSTVLPLNYANSISGTVGMKKH